MNNTQQLLNRYRRELTFNQLDDARIFSKRRVV